MSTTKLASAQPGGAEPAPAPAPAPALPPPQAPPPPHVVHVVREAPVAEASVGGSCMRGSALSFAFFAIMSVVAGFLDAAGVPCAGPLAAGVAGGVMSGGQTAVHNSRRERDRRNE